MTSSSSSSSTSRLCHLHYSVYKLMGKASSSGPIKENRDVGSLPTAKDMKDLITVPGILFIGIEF
jgi:hypothetical protein